MHPADGYGGLGGRLIPLGRIGQVSDVVDGVLFLESSPYITGEILHIDGDPNRRTGHEPLRPLVRPSDRLAQAAPARRAARGGSRCRAW